MSILLLLLLLLLLSARCKPNLGGYLRRLTSKYHFCLIGILICVKFWSENFWVKFEFKSQFSIFSIFVLTLTNTFNHTKNVYVYLFVQEETSLAASLLSQDYSPNPNPELRKRCFGSPLSNHYDCAWST